MPEVTPRLVRLCVLCRHPKEEHEGGIGECWHPGMAHDSHCACPEFESAAAVEGSHWDGCWRAGPRHWACAVAYAEKVGERAKTLEAGLAEEELRSDVYDRNYQKEHDRVRALGAELDKISRKLDDEWGWICTGCGDGEHPGEPEIEHKTDCPWAAIDAIRKELSA